MYEGGVPENIISEKSGHRSLRAYEKTLITQEKDAGATLKATVDHSAEHTTEDIKPCLQPGLPEHSMEDVKPSLQPGLPEHSMEDVKPCVQPGLPTFSGLQNCTFNFYTA